MSHIMNSKINKNKSRTPIVVDDDYCVNFRTYKMHSKNLSSKDGKIYKGISIVEKNINSKYKEDDISIEKTEKTTEKNNNIVIR